MMDDARATKKSAESIAAGEAALAGFAKRYRDDPDLRARLDAGEVADCLADLDISLPPGVEVRFVANTRDTFHVVLPVDPNRQLVDESLSTVSGGTGGKTANTAGHCASSHGGSTLVSTVGSTPGPGTPPSQSAPTQSGE